MALVVTFLAHQAMLMMDAIGRTLFRLLVSQRNLLQWVTAAQAHLSFRLTLPGAYRRMAGAVAIAAVRRHARRALPTRQWLAVRPFLDSLGGIARR